MKPVIGLPQPGHDLFRMYMKSKYAASLRRAGARIRWIELTDPDQAVAQMLRCDGMLITGGADIDPSYYGHPRQDKCGKPNPLRDSAELAMVKAWLPTSKPIFGICRGAQVLNVALGGTMLQDISHIQQVNHSDFKNRGRCVHQVTIPEDTLLHTIAQATRIGVNSMHHQAVDIPGDNLVVSARSGDGFIEALELPGHPFCLGLQWHPEHLSAGDPIQQAFFNAFVAACRNERR